MDRRRAGWGFAALVALHVAAIWSVAYFPSQDGPSHLYNARLLSDLLDPSNFQIRQVFEFNPALHPNLLPHLILAPLQRLVSPPAAEKLLASLAVALLPLSLAYLVRGLRPGHAVFALLGFLFAKLTWGAPLLGLNLLSALCGGLALLPALSLAERMVEPAGAGAEAIGRR